MNARSYLNGLLAGGLAAGGAYALARRRLEIPVFPVGALQARHPEDLNSGIPASYDGAHPSGSRFYFEWWYFDAEFEDGHKVIVVFQTPDMRYPLKRENCVVMIYLQEPSGESRRHYVTFPLGSLEASTETCRVEVGGNYARGEHPLWELHVAYEDITLDLEFRNLVPGWSRGTGSVLYGAPSLGHELGWLVPQPRAEVTGTVACRGETHPVRGSGYHDHNWGSAPLFLYITCWHWGRLVSGDLTLIYADVMASRLMRHITVPCLLVTKGDRLLVEVSEATKWEFRAEDYVWDEQGAQVYPRRVRMAFEERDVKGTLDLYVKRTWEIKETMQVLGVPQRLRPLTDRFMPAPVYYRFITGFELELDVAGEKEVHRGETVTEYMVLTLRRGQRPPSNFHLYHPPARPLAESRRRGPGALGSQRLSPAISIEGGVGARHPDDLNSGLPDRCDAAHPYPGRSSFEWWYFDARFDDGHTFAGGIIDRAVFDLKKDESQVFMHFNTPGGEAHHVFGNHPKSLFSASAERCDVSLAGSTITGACPEWRVDLEHGGFEAHLTFRSLTPGWARGNGEMLFGNLQYPKVLGWVVPQPRAAVTGTLVYDGVEHRVSGEGYHDHNWGNFPFPLRISRWHWGRVTSPDVTMVFVDIATNRSCGEAHVPVLLLAVGDRLVLETYEMEWWYGDYALDSTGTQSYPRSYGFEFAERDVSGRVEFSPSAELEVDGFFGRFGVPGPLAGALARVVAQPCYFRLLCDYQARLEVAGETVELSGETVNEYIVFDARRGVPPAGGGYVHFLHPRDSRPPVR